MLFLDGAGSAVTCMRFSGFQGRGSARRSTGLGSGLSGGRSVCVGREGGIIRSQRAWDLRSTLHPEHTVRPF